jgi:hypothetical protein
VSETSEPLRSGGAYVPPESAKEEMTHSWMGLSLSDAANNCRDSSAARATLTLKSGVSFTGKLEKSPDWLTAMLVPDGGGFVTVLVSEIAAVRSHWKDGR